MDLAALMRKKAKKGAKEKKGKKGKKGGGKSDGAPKATPTKPAEEQKGEAPVESKEERNKNGRA